MPLYEYRCEDCGADYELRRPIGAGDEPAACPECASEKSHRRISLFVSHGTKSPDQASTGGGCACGGSCACGGHSMN